MLEIVIAVAFGVLLASNVWLLREVEHVKRQLEAYQREVAALDNRVCELMYQIEDEAENAETNA